MSICPSKGVGWGRGWRGLGGMVFGSKPLILNPLWLELMNFNFAFRGIQAQKYCSCFNRDVVQFFPKCISEVNHSVSSSELFRYGFFVFIFRLWCESFQKSLLLWKLYWLWAILSKYPFMGRMLEFLVSRTRCEKWSQQRRLWIRSLRMEGYCRQLPYWPDVYLVPVIW